MRKAPDGFDALVHQHFREFGPKLLRDCQRYSQSGGAKVGTLEGDGDGDGEGHSTHGFQLMLRKIIPKLEEAVGKLGSLAPVD